jgi:hypothetical protein
VTVGLGRNVLGLTLLGLVTSHQAVLSSIRPYLRACKLLRKLAFPWWRRFESPRMRVVYAYERDHVSAVVACIPEGDQQGDPSEGDRLLAQDHSVKLVWAVLKLILGEPQSLKGVEVHEVEVVAPVHEGLSELGCPNQRVDNEGKPPWLRDAARVVHLVKSDQGFELAQVLRDCHGHGIDRPACELELAARLVCVCVGVHHKLT